MKKNHEIFTEDAEIAGTSETWGKKEYHYNAVLPHYEFYRKDGMEGRLRKRWYESKSIKSNKLSKFTVPGLSQSLCGWT